MQADGEHVAVFLPGDHIDSDDELVCDTSAYVTLNEFSLDWPCLSFDIVRDGLGEQRSAFPMTSYVVAGTQAAQPAQNKIAVFKVTNIREVKPEEDEDGLLVSLHDFRAWFVPQ